MSELGLAQAIGQLRREVDEALLNAGGERLQFLLGPVELDLSVELSTQGEAGIDAKWVVVSIGGKLRGERTSSHRVKLTLTPQYDGKGDLKIGNRIAKPG